LVKRKKVIKEVKGGLNGSGRHKGGTSRWEHKNLKKEKEGVNQRGNGVIDLHDRDCGNV